MVPAHEEPFGDVVQVGPCVVQVIALDASGAALGAGLRATSEFVQHVLGKTTA